MKKFNVFYFMGGEEEQITIEGMNLFDLHLILEGVLHQKEIESVYKVEEVFIHDDEKYEDEFVDDKVLNSFVGAPN
jgi:hypothetical protein